MKICLDTNVWLSSFIGFGTCHDLIKHIIKKHEIIISPFILSEITEKLENKFKFSTQQSDKIEAYLKKNCLVVSPQRIKTPVCRDPNDLPILATAVAGQCDCLITGDKDLLVLKAYHGVPILRPNDFWRWDRNSP